MPSVEKYRINEAFDYFCDTEEGDENERCVLAVAYLLTFCSQGGNESLDGDAAIGLARVLKSCASEMARVEARRLLLARNGSRQ